ncbi:MAG: AMMECR1 domain-containing protein, partial [Pseudomonadota bacterium]
MVGYGAWALYEEAGRAAAAGDEGGDAIRAAGPTLVALARAAIEHDLGVAPPPAPTRDGVLGGPGAAFVTLKRGGQLRGCIGSVTAWRPLAEDVADNARKAAF